ncbi:MAG: cob(I)yrinic acid a,c-diamide adenosyltransferase [Clostridia bacterium]|nr:cob(I)yrinic acid a,c-diamide adenosyltransferase [Clostridia bacterium]
MNKLHVYTGDGKGKTTAAMGLALRSAGHGNKVLVAQFMKKGNSGELKAFGGFDNVRVMTANPIKGFTFRLTDEEKQSARADQTAFAKQVALTIAQWRPQTIILDELGIALALDMVEENSARELIENALSSGETAVTGREVPDWLKEKADYVSRITAEKHPYVTEKLPARKGVEW